MTKNFSRSKWEDRVQPVEQADGPIRVSISRPEQGFKALFVELEFRNSREQPYRLTTQAKVIEPVKQ
jgi:PhoPQ-activated pathogenicity-related protein